MYVLIMIWASGRYRMKLDDGGGERHASYTARLRRVKNSENCLVTGDLATDSPVHLCHVIHERYWRNHPMVTLMLSMDIVDKLWDRWVKYPIEQGSVPSIEDIYDSAETFEYRLVPLFPVVSPISHRNKAEGCSDGQCDESAGTSAYSYPFDNLPPIFSRVKPHSVVCDARRKLDSIFPRWYIPSSGMARIYGISDEKVEYATLMVYQLPRSGLIRPGQPTSASQRASHPKQPSNVVRYATSLSRVTASGSGALIVGDSGWDTKADAEYMKLHIRYVIKAPRRWVRKCKREVHYSGGWESCVIDDE
ncbi:hypothetical protein HETIRDRAFT_416489 [Heterobasidion irregulare TC 32-1]|uniref:Uncharacterized protein n=1 Tax=Heterobasidion irregulare (strain TC 32-1) TaxID=747525 RepID=W4KGP5_HETIT|nr:uncharacterized protein HETIRDRAFT_416489 [Heterobasidion irregulare TC 32-1]ETW84879.1 hypothetical protein HETIRDRAFT_416489 [Heterobasidion irregulare TC 32-1]